MQQLSERGIYTLAEGGEFVAHAVFRDDYVLYTPVSWEFLGIHAYESGGRGHIQLYGRSTRWHIQDLTDTAGTALSRSRSGAALNPFIDE